MGEKCNGWTNRETWLVSLWFAEDIEDLREGGNLDAETLRDTVEGWLDATLDQCSNPVGFIRDMMGIGAVNWQELADNFAESD